ncbi:Levanase [subsurface metagenome]
MDRSKLYQEVYRPQFHFTAKKNWLNDPNGLVYYQGEYHLFFQHNPSGINWANTIVWGHAVSSDMVNWKQLANAIEPDELGAIWSGSGVVDWDNTAGFQSGKEAAMVNIYTSAGKPFTQSIAYSNDRGRTWRKYEKNPVLGHIIGTNRDPKVIWHASSKRWVMALYLDGNNYALFSSPNLKQWTRLCDIQLPGSSECPDIFELPVDGDTENSKWVFWGANGNYIIGTFDGRAFRRESEVLQSDGGANFYAAQTWSDVPTSDGRRLQITWMRDGKYPGMPFNQQMSFPCQLTLQTTPEGILLYRQPIKEIKNIHKKEYYWNNQVLKPGENLLSDVQGELFHIQTEIEVESAAEFGFILHGESIRYTASNNELFCLGKSASLRPIQGKIKLEILLDRTSLEIFGNHGRISMSSCFLPDSRNRNLKIYSSGGSIRILSLKVYELGSIWSESELQEADNG